MPIQPTYPGVYIQEVSSGVRTITGVATSVAAFFGRTAKGPINKPVHCPDYSTFLRKFGGADSRSDLANSVKQFYDNGGGECYVVRLAHNARKANITLRDLNNKEVLVVSAKDEGTWGNNLRLEVDYNTASPDETFNLRVIHVEKDIIVASESHENLSMNPSSPRYAVNFVTQSSNLVDVAKPAGFVEVQKTGYSESRRPLVSADAPTLRVELNKLIYDPPAATAASKFEISVDGGAFFTLDMRLDDATPLAAPADYPALMGALYDKIKAQLPSGVDIKFEQTAIGTTANVLRIVSNTANKQSVKIRPATANDLAAPLMFGVDQGGIEVTRYSNHRPVPTGTYLSGDLNKLADLKQNAFNQITIVGAPAPDNTLNLGTILVTKGNTKPFYEDNLTASPNANSDGIREKLRLLANAINNAPNFPVTAQVRNYYLALIPKSGTFNTAYDVTTSATNIGAGPNPADLKLFTKNVRQYALGNAGASSFQTNPGVVGRDDDGNPLAVTDYTGDALLHTGFYALDKVDLFNLMILPGDADIDESEYLQIASAASTYCENRRAFLLTDAPNDWSKNGNLNQDELKYNEIRTGVKKNMAIFYPRVIFSDGGILRPIGATGMIAGLMARTDSQRGVWKAPAGTEADLRGAFDVEVNLTDNENGILNKQGVNCIRKFPNGIVNWGARTLDGADDFGSEWKYIPIRRLALFLEESLYRGTKWVVFEPNDEPLWAKIRMNINAFMLGLFRQGAFQGSTPDKAFFVKCDAETTTQNDRNLGIVNIIVGFAPLKPAEFVIISIQQMAGELG